jgi:hypothetical protein
LQSCERRNVLAAALVVRTPRSPLRTRSHCCDGRSPVRSPFLSPVAILQRRQGKEPFLACYVRCVELLGLRRARVQVAHCHPTKPNRYCCCSCGEDNATKSATNPFSLQRRTKSVTKSILVAHCHPAKATGIGVVSGCRAAFVASSYLVCEELAFGLPIAILLRRLIAPAAALASGVDATRSAANLFSLLRRTKSVTKPILFAHCHPAKATGIGVVSGVLCSLCRATWCAKSSRLGCPLPSDKDESLLLLRLLW